MPCYQTVVLREGDAMPKVIQVPLPEGKEAVGWAWPNDSIRWHASYESRWFEDFAERWRRALVDERWNFRARLEAACTA